MHRFYLAPANCQGSFLSLNDREAHHALDVLRVRRGERVQVLNGEGGVFECEVAEQGRSCVKLAVIERHFVAPLPYEVTLAQAVPKGKLFEAIIQKATELGVFRIVPLLTERVVGKIEAGDAAHKLEKWKVIAIEAIKQCGSAWLQRFEPPSTIKQFIAIQSKMDLAMVGSLGSDRQHPRSCFEAFPREGCKIPKSISVAIGPEGDFSPEELAALQNAGAKPITLGRLVLRTETAALYCLSIINYELQSRLDE